MLTFNSSKVRSCKKKIRPDLSYVAFHTSLLRAHVCERKARTARERGASGLQHACEVIDTQQVAMPCSGDFGNPGTVAIGNSHFTALTPKWTWETIARARGWICYSYVTSIQVVSSLLYSNKHRTRCSRINCNSTATVFFMRRFSFGQVGGGGDGGGPGDRI